MDGRPPRSLTQPALVLGAGFVWAWFPLPTVAALVWAYLALVLVAGLLRGRGIGRDVRLPWPLALAAFVVLAAPLAWALDRHGAAMRANAQLEGLTTVYADRARGRPASRVHPPVLAADRPQALWIVHDAPAPLTVTLGAGGPRVPADSVGPGVWRAAYDPRAHGPLGEGALEVTARGARVGAVTAHGPRVRPRALDEVPGGGAVAVSEETDALIHLDATGALARFAVEDGPIRAVATSSTEVVVAHRFAPDLRRYRLGDGAALGAWPAGHDLVDLAGRDGRVAVVARAPSRLRAHRTDGGAWQVDLPFVPRRVFPAPEAGAWFVEAEGEGAVYRVTRAGVRRRARLGRPIYDGRLTDAGCLELFVPDYRPRGDSGPNHHVADHRVTLCAGRGPRAAETLVRDDDGDVIGGAGPRAVGAGGAIAFTGTDEIQLPGASRIAAPLTSPDGIARLGPGRWAVSSGAAGRIAVIDDAGRRIAEHDLTAGEAAGAATLRRGERAFLEATRGGAACETCHVDADSDRARHDIGHPTPRPTLSVRGVAGTAPYLRVASYPDLSGLEHFAQTILGGYRRDAPTRAADLVAYVQSLPPLPPRRRLPRAAWQRGWRAFAIAGCPSCHPPPAFTNRAQYPQHVLFPGQPSGVLLDTPSLLGVAASAPYLYDGRAAHLDAVWRDHDPAGRHGRFAALEPDAQADLLRFLEGL